MRIGEGNIQKFLQKKLLLPSAPTVSSQLQKQSGPSKQVNRSDVGIHKVYGQRLKKELNQSQAKFISKPQAATIFPAQQKPIPQSRSRPTSPLDPGRSVVWAEEEKQSLQILSKLQNRSISNKRDNSGRNTVGIVVTDLENRHFQSARMDSMQCLQAISFKLNSEVSSINCRIEQFRSAVMAQLTQRLYSLHQEVIRIVEEAFKEGQRQIDEHIRQEEVKVASQLLNMRKRLESEQSRVQELRGQLEKPTWRKAAGQILATNLPSRAKSLVDRSALMMVERDNSRIVVEAELTGLRRELSKIVGGGKQNGIS